MFEAKDLCSGYGSVPVLRNVKSIRVDDKDVLTKPMTLVTDAQIALPGMIAGTGSTIVIDNTTDNTLTTFAYANKAMKFSIAPGHASGSPSGSPTSARTPNE